MFFTNLWNAFWSIPRRLYEIGRTILSTLWVIPSLILRFGWVAKGLVVLLLVGVLAASFFYWAGLPAPVKVYDAVWLDQGWTEDQAQAYFQTSQGTLIIPYTWWQSLEQPPGLPRFMSSFFDIGRVGIKNEELWRSDDNVSTYRLMPDPIPTFNPDRNPIGVVKAVLKDDVVQDLGLGHKEWMSYSCAACHTGQLNYKGLGIRVNGMPAQWNFAQFNTVMTTTLIFTRSWPTKFDRFARRVFHLEGRPYTDAEKDKLKKEIDEYLRSTLVTEALSATAHQIYPTVEGFGRTAALGRGGNLQFFPLSKDNDKLSQGPVSFPPLWYTHEFDWVQSPAAIRQPLGRNVTESWGVNVVVDIVSSDPEKLFRSTHPMFDLFWMETLVSILEPPPWPEEYFGEIDWASAERGRILYEEKENPVKVPEYCDELSAVTIAPPDLAWQPCPNPKRPQRGLCASCHRATEETIPNQWGRSYVQLPLYHVDVIGTDKWDAFDFNANVGALNPGTGTYAKEFAASPWGTDSDGKARPFGIGTGLSFTTTRIMDRWFEENDIEPFTRPEMEGFRQNAFRAPLAYPARPLAGYWATAPYLHNGSVPNMYELLSPVEERSESFFAGNLEFDPVKLGFESDRFRGGFQFRTRRGLPGGLWSWIQGLFSGSFTISLQRDINGNSNAGHEFRNAPDGTPGVIGPELSHQERMDIIEYMKVLRDGPKVSPEELQRRRDMLAKMAGDYEKNPAYVPKKVDATTENPDLDNDSEAQPASSDSPET